MGANSATLDALRNVVDDARLATPGDDVDGVDASYVVSPASVDQTSQALRVAADHLLTVVPRGAATKLAWGAAPSSADLVLDTTRMDKVVEHAAGDLVVTVQAGARLDDVQSVLSPAGQRLAIDPVVTGGTVGGVVATGVSGPLRLSHGAVRDLVIGVTFVRADGVIAKAGGKVVKNVAGYDLGKLMAGSWGTLGVITGLVFRLHPLPSARRWVTVDAQGPDDLLRLVHEVVHSQLVPTAAELDQRAGSPPVLSVLFDGLPEGVEARATSLLGRLGSAAQLHDESPPWWGRLPWEPGGVGLRVTHEIAGVARLLEGVARSGAQHGVSPAVRGSVGVGVVHVALPADVEPEAAAAFITTLREAAPAWNGQVVVLAGARSVKQRVDVWGPAGGLELMRRIKERFDPERRLSPGRFVGGI